MKNLLFLGCLCIFLTLTGCVLEESISTSEISAPTTQNQQEEHEFPRFEVPVVRVIDGDTIKVLINGKEENVRFLLVDTPETSHPRMNGPQPYGKEAKELMENLLEGGTVELEMDVSERDRYGRLLAYLYVNGVSVQEELLRNGLARVAYIYPPNTRYVDDFQAIQKKAQEEGVGIWSVENYAQEDGFYPEYVEDPTLSAPTEDNSLTENCTIKGNINSSGEKIYHVPTGVFYDRTIPEECFNTEKEAEAAGYRKSKR
jgi:micrococcal nuclease